MFSKVSKMSLKEQKNKVQRKYVPCKENSFWLPSGSGEKVHSVLKELREKASSHILELRVQLGNW